MAHANTFVEKDSSKYLLTWNSQGNKFQSLWNWLDTTNGLGAKVNVVACQEFGDPAAMANGKDETDHCYDYVPFQARDGGMHVFQVRWSRTHNNGAKKDNFRCSLAIIRCGPKAAKPSCMVLAEDSARPIIGIEYGPGFIFSFHNDAHKGAGKPGRSMADYLNSAVPKGTPWMLAGDFNCPPSEMTGKWNLRYDKTRTTTRRNTLTGQEIAGDLFDYVVQSSRSGTEERALSNHIGNRLPAVHLSSDHFPVLFQIYSTKGMA